MTHASDRARPEVAPLLALSERIARDTGRPTPTIDPNGPGVRARVLMVAESPGPGDQGSGSTGVLSPYANDDPTARNMRKAIMESGLDPSVCVYWNAVPQTVVRGKLTAADRATGVAYLRDFVALCPELRAIVALGRHAQRGCSRAGLDALATWHPSPLGLYGGGAVGRYDELVATFRLAAQQASAPQP